MFARKFSIVHRITTLVALCAVLAFLGVWGLSRKEHASAREDRQNLKAFMRQTDLARETQVEFKRQVQEWKNILIRGTEISAFEQHRDAFIKQEAVVQRSSEELLQSLSEPHSKELARKFIIKHKELGSLYRAALENFTQNGRSDIRSIDAAVGGIDRDPTDLLSEIVLRTKEDFHSYELAQVKAADGEEGSRTAISAGICGGLIVASFLLARRITRPIHELARTISKVSAERDYSLRAPALGRDEIGMLAQGFNAMLATIQEQNAALEDASNRLELLVAERTRSLEEEIRERQGAEKQAREQYRNLRALLDLVPGAVVFKDTTNRIIIGNKFAADAAGVSIEELEGASVFELHPKEAAQYYADDLEVIRSGKPKLDIVEPLRSPEGEVRWIQTDKVPVFDDQGTVNGVLMMAHDITEQRQIDAEMERMSKQLLQLSRQAGMSEVASSVLHNVGNVLNSVNISCSVTADKVRKSRISSVAKTAAMLREHAENLPEFVRSNPSGQKLPEFLSLLSERLQEEQAGVLHELDLLGKNLEHIKEIVVAQQNYANLGGMTEAVPIEALVEDALCMNHHALRYHRVEIHRDFQPVSPVRVDKHKTLQILINLLRNAKHAMIDGGRDDKRLVVRILPAENGHVAVSVIDNGIGIPAENMTRIFAHGFTTKKNGHGFGLHSAALAAQEMGGSLTAHSDGANRGATFTLHLRVDTAA